MGVYIHQNNIEKELKKWYIWEYVEPIFNYSYDFTTWSVADLQSKWWTVANTATINSNGYRASGWKMTEITDSDLANAAQSAKKLITEFGWSWSWSQQRTFALLASWAENSLFYWDWLAHLWWNQASFGWVTLFNLDDGYGASWTFTMTLEVNLTNKTRECIGTNWFLQSWTITDAQITSFRWVDWIHIYAESRAYIRSIGVTIY